MSPGGRLMTQNNTGLSPVATGVRGRCPRCGEGRLFKGYLTIASECDSCGLDYSFADSADAPAFLVMFPAGTLVVAFWLITDAIWHWPVFVHLILAVPTTILSAALFLRPVKGVIVNMQYTSGARIGGDPGERID